MEYEIVIGLEVHAQLLLNTKLFCGCTTKFGQAPNSQGCPVCLGMPGSLPVLNRTAVEFAIKAGLALGCAIAPRSIFARKNYFYPDLPKGYQISQYDMPICIGGSLPIVIDGKEKQIGITRIHIEEDAGKLIHDQDIDTLFDVNRCGTPLIEIVSEPDMRSAQEAYAYLAGLKQILEYLNVCDCNMEEGSLRCDANISLRPKGEKKLGTKAEIKNMNSFRGLEKALEYEAARQEEILRSGGTIIQQTYSWDASTGTASPMRSKEDAHDYRYFPEPDLLPLIIEQRQIDKAKQEMPELPMMRKKRYETELGIGTYASEVLTGSRALGEYFELVLTFNNDPKTVANWIMGDVLRIVNDQKKELHKMALTPKRLGTLLSMINQGAVSAKAARKVIDAIEEQDKEPEVVVKELGLEQVSDTSALESAVDKIIEANPQEVSRYRGGEKKLISFFVGQVMKATKGAGNPKEINVILQKKLG